MRLSLYRLWVAGVLVTGLQLQAQTTNPAPVTVEALVSEAVRQNPELRYFAAENSAARALLKQAGTRQNPELSTTLGHNSAAGAGDSVAWSVALMQPFEWPGRIGLRKAIANRDVELAELGLQRFQAALAAKVRTLGYTLYVAQEKQAVVQEVSGRLDALRDVLVQRDPAGLTPQLETRVMEAMALAMQRQITEQELALQSALLELNHLRGRPAAETLRITTTDPALPEAPALSALLNRAFTNNFDLRVREKELQQQVERLELARHERKPTISAGPMISEERAGGTQRTIGIGVSLPLPLWNNNRNNIEVAKARQLQAETALVVAKRDLDRKVTEAYGVYQAKLRELAKWRNDSVTKFQESAALADRHYRLGAVPATTYVELQKQYLEAVTGLLDTKREALEAALQLEALTGEALVRAGKETSP